MKVRRPRAIFSVMMAVFLLSLAVISRAPQSKCRCGGRKAATAQESKPCVFGQMRSLTGAFVLPASVSPKDRSVLVVRPLEVHLPHGYSPRGELKDRPRERSPPVSMTSFHFSA